MDMNYGLDSSIYPDGTIIAERYKITSFLAQGGMAQVYIATQQLVEGITRSVALKILLPSFSTNPDIVMRFFDEARAIIKLEHPNTIRLYDMGETPDHRLFLAMELLKGKELSERIKESKPIDPVEAFTIAKDVAGSLAEAHQCGIIHRDLKPDNIFITDLNVVKVLDFGIAKLKSENSEKTPRERRLTRAGTAPGTPEYMSPEQARGKELDARSDLYSLGIVIYEMLCKHPPFEEPTFLGTILQQVQATPPPLPESIPEPMRNYVIQRLLAKEPKDRPKDAMAFIREVDELLKPMDRLHKAEAEIESLREQLAQTKLELMRSSDMGVIADEQPYLPPAQCARLQVGDKVCINTRDNSISAQQQLYGGGAGYPGGSHDMSGLQTNRGFGQQGMPYGMQPQRSGVMPSIPGMPSMPSGDMGCVPGMGPQPQRSGVMPSIPGMPSMPSGDMGCVPGMGAQSQRSGVMPVAGMPAMSRKNAGIVNEEDEPIIPPAPRRGAMPNQVSLHASNMVNSHENSGRNLHSRTDEWVVSGDVSTINSRPRDTLTGTVLRNHIMSSDKENVFITFANPMFRSLGTDNAPEVLDLAKNIWNATLMGQDAVNVLLDSAQKQPNLRTLIELMVKRKRVGFGKETWMIEKLDVSESQDKRLVIRIE